MIGAAGRLLARWATRPLQGRRSCARRLATIVPPGVDRYGCPTPPPKPTVTICHSRCLENQYVALLLKQCPYIEEIRLHDDVSESATCGPALDLAHIDTHCKVRSFCGTNLLKDAMEGAHLILIGGHGPKNVTSSLQEEFDRNADYVRSMAIHAAEFNPNALLCVATPPVCAMVPMVTEEYKKARVFDPRRVVGLSNLSTVYANTLCSEVMKMDVKELVVPVIGGDVVGSMVLVFSQMKPKKDVSTANAALIKSEVNNCARAILSEKAKDGDRKTGLSMLRAFANARFMSELCRALTGAGKCTEFAFVRQTGQIGKLSPFLTTIVNFGPEGIESCYLPPLTNDECDQLHSAVYALKKHITLGQTFVTGQVGRDCRVYPRVSDDCTVVEVAPAEGFEKYSRYIEQKMHNIEVYP